MTLSALMGTACTIVRRSDSGSTDTYGNPTQAETLVTTTCSLQQRQRDESATEGELSETLWDAFFPTGTAIDTSDGVVIGTSVYEVVGQPWSATEGSTAVHHVEATLKRTAASEDVS